MKSFLPVAFSLLAMSPMVVNAQEPDPTIAAANQNLAPAKLVSPTKAASPAITAAYGKLPLSFEANRGQSDPQVKFLSRGQGYSLFLTDTSAVLSLSKDLASQPKTSAIGGKAAPQKAAKVKTDVVRMELAGAARGMQVSGADPLPGKANYFLGKDSSKWHTNVPTYAKVKYSNVYPGIDLVYYGNQRQLEYDFVVAANADPKQARLHFAGASKLKLNSGGDLEIIAKDGEIAFHKPVVYQLKDGQRQPVEGSFQLLANNTVGFRLASYDQSRELVIDPVLAYSTYLGAGSDTPDALAVDAEGNLYLSVENDSPYLVKFDAAGSTMIYSTSLPGTGSSNNDNVGGIYGIAVDATGNAYLTGAATISNFPVTPGAFQTVYNSINGTGFVTKLNPTGGIVYSTLLGGSSSDFGTGIEVDAEGNAFVAGYTSSADFPTTAGAFQPKANITDSSVGFVTKLNAAGSSLIYSTFLQSTSSKENISYATGIEIDGTGDAYVAGYTHGPDFPTTPGAYSTVNTYTAYVAKLNPEGSGLVYSTYFPSEGLGSMAVDSAGDVYSVASTGPVTSGAFQASGKGWTGKLNSTGTALIYGTYVGGTGELSGKPGDLIGIAVDHQGHAFVSGYSYGGFPVTPGAFQTTYKGVNYPQRAGYSSNGVLAELNADGSALLYATYLGGSGNIHGDGDSARQAVIDGFGNVYINGIAASRDFPVTGGAFQTTNEAGGAGSPFVAKFAFHGGTTTTVTSNHSSPVAGEEVTFTAHVEPVSGTGIPPGEITWKVDGTVVAQSALNGNGSATYSTILFAPQHVIAASYLGEPDVYSASSGALTVTASQVGPPIFAVADAPGDNPVEQLMLSSTTPNTSIYYTINGGTPTPSSRLYHSPITILGTMHIQAIAVYNSASSMVSSATYTSPTYPTTPGINFSQGFPLNTSAITTNGSAAVLNGDLYLTQDGYDQAGSSFYATPVNVQSFTADFTLHISGNADGMTFTIQNSGPKALGGDGAGLGYVTIQKSLAIKFDIWDNVGEGPDSTGLYTGGNTPTVPAINLLGTGINLADDIPYGVHVTYDGAILNMTITNLFYAPDSFSHSWAIDIPATVGGSTAYVGFTGSTGGTTSHSVIQNWTYLAGAPAGPRFPTGLNGGIGLYLNGVAVPAGPAIQLTTGGENQAGSLFFPNAQNIQSFTSQFSFQIADPAADGLTFTIQGVGPVALGGIGGGLGYASIPKSVALKFDLFNNAGEGVNSTGVYIAGVAPTLPAINLAGTGINLHSGDPMVVGLVYANSVLTMTITDQITKAQYTHPFSVDIPSAVGGNTAYVGFTGATGGEVSTQSILNWTFTPKS
ncbi:Cell surface protein [Acidisarcina polymorpha]|uniref:Cell surface protein n=1 Tax=Acidisarcina polymorpha TaxID=2211140 RepID=A0A2Z5FX92_9BACT|nr:SBBP repeat-containing protein [Acidisarcina polymorpha]AXC11340.1 Cell surface protein [Acidisarcina polymorpha]